MDKQSALQRLAESRQALQAALADLPEEDWEHPGVEGKWNAVDVLAHITTWEETILAPLRAYASSGVFTPETIPDHLAWNDAQERQWQSQTTSSIFEDLAHVRAEILTLAETLPEDLWEPLLEAPWGGKGSLAQILSGLAWHEEEHTRSLFKWLQERRL
jgi:uncharacterized damage-inducible protein DinB